MKWKKSSPELIEFFNSVVPDHPKVQKRKMFGYPCCFINGNMFMGLHQEHMILRLSPENREDFLQKGAEEFSPMPGRVMREYAAIPENMKYEKKKINPWIDKSLEFALSLPKKKKKLKRHSNH